MVALNRTIPSLSVRQINLKKCAENKKQLKTTCCRHFVFLTR